MKARAKKPEREEAWVDNLPKRLPQGPKIFDQTNPEIRGGTP
jgi:hypothetical protein